MKTISLCMIVKNEEEVLEQCLSSVESICDEIIILDTGSKDSTKDIAKKFTNKVFDFEWIDHFAAARNKAFSYATKDFIFWLDADDVLLPEDIDKLRKLKQELHDDIDAVSMYYYTAFDEEGNPTFKYRRNRLVKRTNNFKWYGAVHEYLQVGGNVVPSEIGVTHRKQDKPADSIKSDRNLKIYEKQLANKEPFTPRDMFYYANELKDHMRLDEAIDYYQQFLDTKRGWIEDEIRACIYIADCFKIMQLPEEEVEALLQSLKYDLPRAEVSCRVGDYFKEKGMFKKAIIWYVFALTLEADNDSGFANIAYTTWYPHLQMCYCNWQIGNKKDSYQHHLQTKKYLPNNEQVLYNEAFFNSLDQEELT
ncbi:glycosyltransferase family 2 protein [Virgibacillus salexigens]|uniref:SPBc2 prophage-derived glycosyltransferase SunS n=2 Tax=Virgibacillus TaxID=84406 RepID=A0A024QG20_9BACI|nr:MULTISPECIES: glycosyltransferase family 2 protein [Virgibacillus]GGJ71282.1 beta 1,4 glucosyltransferase [Virgibacillus kapii]CDQ41192.1 SPBc2 prophage-derived glycosyltransferase SunS [Virgibacillus massiliensis]